MIKNTNTPLLTFDINFDDLDNDTNYILNIPGQISTDPEVCLLPTSKFEILYNNSFIGFTPTVIDDVLNGAIDFKEGKYLGRLSNVLVNVNFIAEVLSQMDVDNDGNLNLLQFLKHINKGIIESTGNINDFEIKLNEDQTQIRFVENIPQNGAISGSQDYAKFNVFGVKENIEGSFIRNINLTADLSNDFATMVTIGAQANANQVTEDATSFSNYNAGLEDRIIKTRYSSNEVEKDKEKPNKIEELFTLIQNQTSSYEAIYVNGEYSSPTILSFKENMNTAIKSSLGIMSGGTQFSKPTIQSPFFLTI